MLGKTYDDQYCSVARSLEVVGERWSLLILRDAILSGVTRFGDFQHNLGIATNVLTSGSLAGGKCPASIDAEQSTRKQCSTPARASRACQRRCSRCNGCCPFAVRVRGQ